MLEMEIKHFLTYCKVSDFSKKSIESLTIRLNEFNNFLKTTNAASLKDISCQEIRGFIAEFKTPSVHIKKGRVWTLHQFFHFLRLNGWVSENIARDIPYPKIEKTIPHFLTIEEYNRILHYFFKKAIDFVDLRNLVIIMMLGLLGLRLGSILSLNIEDIDLEAGLLWFTDRGGKGKNAHYAEDLVYCYFPLPQATRQSTGAVVRIRLRLGTNQAILLIFKYYRPNNRCFEALKSHFQG